jgi:mannose-6-phosphate isomerase
MFLRNSTPSMDVATLAPFRLKPWFSPRPWGRRSLEPWYSAAQVGTAEPVGEAWLTGPESIIESGALAGNTLAQIAASQPSQLLGPQEPITRPAEFPLLVKLLFPAGKLSVQVHPDDAHAQAMGQPRGKTECWYVLQADPGARIALGLTPGATPDSVRAAIAAGTLEDLLQWVPVAPGDMFFVDAGTVHAIGPGMVLLETQQTSDITFRMYDYGRPRELHVDQALRVMKTHTAAGKIAPQKLRTGSGAEFTRLIQQRYFTVDRYDLAPGDTIAVPASHPGCMVTLTGTATVHAGSQPAIDALPGHAIILPVSDRDLTVHSASAGSFVHCWEP